MEASQHLGKLVKNQTDWKLFWGEIEFVQYSHFIFICRIGVFFFLFTEKTCAISVMQSISKAGKHTIETYTKVLMKSGAKSWVHFALSATLGMTIKLSWLITWFHPWHNLWKRSKFPSKTTMFSLLTVNVFRSREINTTVNQAAV